MFGALNKMKALEELGQKAGELLQKAAELDTDGNGVPDGVQMLQELQELPALIQKEGGDVVEEAEEARKVLRDKFNKIIALAGNDAKQIKIVAAKEIEIIRARIEELSPKPETKKSKK